MAIAELQTEEEELLTPVAELVLAAQDGDRYAFGLLVERYERNVYAVALRRTGDHAEAQELAQEVFVQALRKIGQLREPAAFGGWLRSITVRLSINRAARNRAVATIEPEVLDANCIENDTPFAQAISHERKQLVHSALRKLGKLDRETLVAFYLRGKSLIEMSDDFDSPVGTIKRRLHVARKRFAAAFDYADGEEMLSA